MKPKKTNDKGQKVGKTVGAPRVRPASHAAFAPRVPHWWEDEHTGLRKVLVCGRCHAIYYDKHWHSWQRTNGSLPAGVKFSEALCFACAALLKQKGGAARGYGGEAIFSGLSDIAKRILVVNEIRNIGKRAVARDPEAQIIKIEDLGGSLRVTTTQPQLAASIGKQIDSAFKGGKLRVIWSKDNLPARVRWTSPPAKRK